MLFFKKKFVIFLASILLILVFFGFSSFCLAEDKQLQGLEETASGVGYTTITGDTDVKISDWIGMIIKSIIGFIGVIFMVLIWMGAFDIVGAGGNDEKVAKGRDKIKNGAIGILIVFASYLFANMVLEIVGGGTGGIFKF